MNNYERKFKRKDLARRVKELLIERGINQSDLSRLSSLGTDHVSHIVRNGQRLTLESLNELCLALNTTPNYLMYGMDADYVPNYII